MDTIEYHGILHDIPERGGVEGGMFIYCYLNSNIVSGMGTNLKTQNKAVFNIENSK